MAKQEVQIADGAFSGKVNCYKVGFDRLNNAIYVANQYGYWTLFSVDGSGGTTILLQTNTINNSSQLKLNLIEGSNITLTDTGSGNIIVSSTGGDTTIINNYFESTTFVSVATTAPLPANTYNNGASGVGATLTGNANGALTAQDGVTPVVDMIILVKDEVDQKKNGPYKVTTVGTADPGGTPYLLTRLVSSDTTAELYPQGVVVAGGDTNATLLFTQITVAPIPGTDNIVYGDPIPVGNITLAPIGSTPNANGATLVGNVLNLQPASISFGGVVTAITQSFAGVKTFAPTVTGSGTLAATEIAGTIAATSTSDTIAALNITTTPYNTTGPILLIYFVTAGVGTGYTSGTYTTVPLTGGTGSGAQATVAISGGGISSIIITTKGTGYTAGDVLSFSNASVGGTGSGASMTVRQVGATYKKYSAKGIDNFLIGGTIRVGRGSYDPGDGGTFSNTTTAFGEGALAATPTTIGNPQNALMCYNSAFGRNALAANTLGGQNTAVGYTSLSFNTIGSANTAIGMQCLGSNTSGNSNSAVGALALLSNTTGGSNTAMGASALQGNSTGGSNTAFGVSALGSNTTATGNVGIGYSAGSSNLTSTENVYVGYGAGTWSKIGANTFIGSQAGAIAANTGLGNNVAVGSNAFIRGTQGDNNVAIGANALAILTDYVLSLTIVNGGSGYTTATITIGNSLTTAGGSTAQATATIVAGVITGYTFTGNANGYTYQATPSVVVTGDGTGAVITATLNAIPKYNTAVGAYTGLNMRGGIGNTFLGYKAGEGIDDGNYNTIIGASIGALSTSLSNTIIIADGQGNQRITATTTKTSLANILHFMTTPTNYADNAAALVGGLIAGDVYRIGDTLAVVH